MAGGLFSRLKVWLQQDSVYYNDLNGEFDNVITNMRPDKIDNYSHTVSEMQTTRNPGTPGSEILASSTADELASLRYMIAQIVGGAQWYSTPNSNITSISQTVNASTPPTRIQSGLVDTVNQPKFLVPNGSNQTVQAQGNGTPLTVFIGGTQYILNTNVTSANLTLAPSSNNTATLLAGYGAYDTVIGVLSSVGSNISALVGKMAAFQLGTEYFIGRVIQFQGNYYIDNCQRNFLFQNSGSVYAGQTAGTTLTLMTLAWIYLNNSGALVVSYTNPTYSTAQPQSPATGDTWFNLTDGNWRSYSGSSWVLMNAVLIGVAVVNGSACIAARSFDSFKAYSSLNTVGLEVADNSDVRSGGAQCALSVYGTAWTLGESGKFNWNSSINMETGSIAANLTYYLYVKDTGDVSISVIPPLDRTGDLQGFYHPYKPWRCVGIAVTDGSSHFSKVGPYSVNFASSIQYGLSVIATSQTVTGVTITSVGGPFTVVLSGGSVKVTLMPQGGTGSIAAGATYAGTVYLYRDGVVITSWSVGAGQSYPPSSFSYLDTSVGKGVHTYEIRAASSNSSGTVVFTQVGMAVEDLSLLGRIS